MTTDRSRQVIAYVWSYTVRPEHAAAFRDAYGPEGEWAAFFRQSGAYLGTDLLEGLGAPPQFVTIDYFADRDARAKLLGERGAAYRAIDRKWAAATLEETFVGEFRMHGGSKGPR